MPTATVLLEKSMVFAEGLLVPHSVMPVHGGAYVCSATEFLFLADTDGDDRADEKAVVFSGSAMPMFTT